MAKTEKSGIPAGFKRIESGSFPANHDFKKNPVCTGRVVGIKNVPQKRGKKTENVKILYIADKATGEVTAVWESTALAGLMAQVKQGNTVYIKSLGVKKLKGKKTLKQFECAIGA